MAAIRLGGLNLRRASFIFFFGIVGLQTKRVSKVSRVLTIIATYIHVRTCTIKVQP